MPGKKSFADASRANDVKQQILDERKQRMEFVWIEACDASGSKPYGDDLAQQSIADQEYYEYLTITNNVTIGEPYYDQNI